MTKPSAPLLLVGSIPGTTAEESMRDWGGGLGDQLVALPDGEVGKRSAWITFLAAETFHGNPGLETLHQPVPYDANNPADWRGPGGDWIPLSYEDQWQFAVKDGAQVHFDTLGYAQAALDSYTDFARLRKEGVIAPQVRFQISLPMPESGMRVFLTNADDLETLWDPYSDALKHDLATIFAAIPAEDLAIQWDVCVEILATDPLGADFFPWKAHGDNMERYLRAISDLSPHVPEEALLGIHLCYGDLGHVHMFEPKDLAVSVAMTNLGAEHCGRRLDFTHMPVPRDRNDDAYFEPLHDLAAPDAKLYLGLIHTTGGIAGNLARLATAQRHAADFGVATECGFGRRPREQLPELLEMHRATANGL